MKYRCMLCGRSNFDSKQPHRCVGGFRKRGIKWEPIKKNKMEGLNFGQAIEAAKQGKKVARQGWNGSGMFAYVVPANHYPAQTGAAKSFFGENSMVPYRAYWALKTAQNDIATWAPSGSDSLAEDWIILND